MKKPCTIKATAVMAVAFFCHMAIANASESEVIWHCSKTMPSTQIAQDDSFALAVFGMSSEAIPLSLHDLISVYDAKAVKINGLQVSACVLSSESSLATVKKSLGVEPLTQKRKAEAKKNHPKVKILEVADFGEMQKCISENFPAVGYFPRSVESKSIVACF